MSDPADPRSEANALLDELDSIKELLHTPPTPPVEEQLSLGEAEGDAQELVSADDDIPALEDDDIPVLEEVAGSADEPDALPGREELEALIDILIERRLPQLREQLREELLADLEGHA